MAEIENVTLLEVNKPEKLKQVTDTIFEFLENKR